MQKYTRAQIFPLPKNSLTIVIYSIVLDSIICLDQQYTQDIGQISNFKSKIDTTIPNKVKDRNLIVNESSTEYDNISRTVNTD